MLLVLLPLNSLPPGVLVPPRALQPPGLLFWLLTTTRAIAKTQIILPESAFREVSRLKIPFPIQLELTTARKKGSAVDTGKGGPKATPEQYCGVMEFSAPENQCLIPSWVSAVACDPFSAPLSHATSRVMHGGPSTEPPFSPPWLAPPMSASPRLLPATLLLMPPSAPLLLLRYR